MNCLEASSKSGWQLSWMTRNHLTAQTPTSCWAFSGVMRPKALPWQMRQAHFSEAVEKCRKCSSLSWAWLPNMYTRSSEQYAREWSHLQQTICSFISRGSSKESFSALSETLIPVAFVCFDTLGLLPSHFNTALICSSLKTWTERSRRTAAGLHQHLCDAATGSADWTH